jgi:hypothetical protein
MIWGSHSSRYEEFSLLGYALSHGSAIFTSSILKAIVFVFLMRGIYDVHQWDDLRWHNIYIPSFMNTGTCIKAILRLCLRNLRACNVGITHGRDLWYTLLRCLHVAWYSCKSFTKTGTGVHAILRFCFSNLNGCNVGIIEGKELWSVPLRWTQMAWYTCQV